MENPKTIKWTGGVTPTMANAETPHKKRPGRQSGSHQTWRTKEERELDKAWKELHRKPEEPEWPGPFVPRTDFPELSRKAYWINCAYCGCLFARPVTWVKSRSKGRAGHGTGGSNTFCSINCGRSFNVEPVFRVCAYCSKTFRVWRNNQHRRTCCDTCMRLVQSENRSRVMNMPMIAYAFERGIQADYWALTCDICGKGQKSVGKTTNVNSHHWAVRVAEVDGKYMARCGKCCDRQLKAKKAIEAAMTPAEKLRKQEAQELLVEVLK